MGNEGKSHKQALSLGDDDTVEYTACWESWRFFLAFRSTLLILSFSITSGLLYLYFLKDSTGETLESFPRFIISFLGLVFSYGLIVIEGRNRQMYTACLNRARVIELGDNEPPDYIYGNNYLKAVWLGTKEIVVKLKMQLMNQEEEKKLKDEAVYSYHLASALETLPISFFSWMTGGIFLIYGTIFAIWLSLLIYISITKQFKLTIIVIAIVFVIALVLRAILKRKNRPSTMTARANGQSVTGSDGQGKT